MDINFDLKNISPREIGMVAVTLLSALCYGFYTFEYKAQDAKLKEIREELKNVDVLAGSTQQAIQMIGSLDSVLKETGAIREDIEVLKRETSFVKSRLAETTDVLSGIQKRAEMNKVVVKTMRAKEASVARGKFEFKELVLALVVQSEYESLAKFIADLETLPAVLELTSLETVRKDSILPEVESRMQIKITAL